jgi:hypothetical protein
LSAIAREVYADWGPRINYAAEPYLSALYRLNSIDDNYFADSARSVVSYFLANASTWRGPVARQIKAELNQILKGTK